MRNPNVLRKLILFRLNECEAVKAYLEEMALEGWALKSISRFFYFEKIHPQKLTYSVEVLTDSSKKTREHCKEYGWSFVCNREEVNVFVTDSQNPTPISNSEPNRLNTIFTSMMKQHLFTTIFPLCIFGLWFINFDQMIVSNIVLFAFIFIGICLLLNFIRIASQVVWYIRQSTNLKQGKPIKVMSKEELKKKTISRLTTTSAILLMLLWGSIILYLQGDSSMAIILVTFILVAIIWLLTNLLMKKGYESQTTMIITGLVAAGLGLSLIIYTVLISFVFNPSNEDPRIVERSWLANSLLFELEIENQDPVAVKVFTSDSEFIINQYLYALTHHYFINDFDAVTLPEWETTATYTDEGRYVIKFDSYVISYYSEQALKPEDINKIKTEAQLMTDE